MSSRYTWKNGPEAIQQHSIAKHQILRTYLARYFQTLVGARRRAEFKLTLVDGFAGGGEYYHADTKEPILGSPYICLEAERLAAYEINQNRTNPVKIDVTHIFVEAEKPAFKFLDASLRKNGYSSQIGQSIQLRHGKFEDHVDSIIEFIRKKSKINGRSIFILDQFGYKDVSAKIMHKILNSLKTSEIILTFGVDSLLNFANEKNLESAFKHLNVPNVFENQPFAEIKQSPRNWRLFVQSTLYQALMGACQAKHYTPFFIRNAQGYGDYWLVHLSQHHRARSVMTDVHWANQNSFIHYGGAGLDMFNMLGYDPNFDNDFLGQNLLDFEFDQLSEEASIAKMMDQIPRIITSTPNGTTFRELYEQTCNQTPASFAIYQKCLGQLVAHREILIFSEDNIARTKAHKIELDDHISRNPQIRLI